MEEVFHPYMMTWDRTVYQCLSVSMLDASRHNGPYARLTT